MTFRSFFSSFSHNLAIDLGTANMLVYTMDSGVVIDEASMVAINTKTQEIFAIGNEAKRMLGRTPENITSHRPMKDGVIADFKIAEKMLTHFIKKAHNRKILVYPRIVISVPSEITAVERRAVIDAAYRANASEVFLVEQAMMAAIGANLPITEPAGSMVVDIGGGTTDIAVISISGIVYSRSLNVGGNAMDEAIMQYLKRNHNFLIGEQTAEQVKIGIGNACESEELVEIDVKGHSLTLGIPASIRVSDKEIRNALSGCMNSIVNGIRDALENTPPELSGDICDRGIVLTGGGGLLKNIDQLIREETGLPVSIADNPLHCVVIGTGKLLNDLDFLRKVSIN